MKKHHCVFGVEVDGFIDTFIRKIGAVGFSDMSESKEERRRMFSHNYILLGGWINGLPCMMKVNFTSQSRTVYCVFIIVLKEYHKWREFKKAMEQVTDELSNIYKQEPERFLSFPKGYCDGCNKEFEAMNQGDYQYYNIFVSDYGFTSVIGGHNIDGVIKPRITLGFFDTMNAEINEEEKMFANIRKETVRAQ